MGGFAIGTTEFVTMGLLPEVAAGTGVDIPTAGHYVSSYAAGVVVGAPLLAVLFARTPRKPLLLGLMTVFAVANAASGFAHTYGSLMVARFLSGLPHGAYFGIAMLLAANLVQPHKRTSAVAAILGGLGVANVIGVPLTTWLGQRVSWSWPYWVVGALGMLTVLLVWLWLPRHADGGEASTMRSELRALTHLQVWLALFIGVVGFGGMFATFSYIAPTLIELGGVAPARIPVFLVVYGIGMVVGMALAGRASQYGVLRGVIVAHLAMILLLLVFAPLVSTGFLAWPMVFLLGVVPSILVPLLQTRLMDVAHDGQALAATLNHATLNTANGLGAWLGSLVLAAGWGYAWPSRVGAVLGVLGLGIALASALIERSSRQRTSA